MTLRLILTRHAKSDWGDPMLDDHDRPLNKRGRASARAIGAWLAENGYVAGEALVSTALRTRETWNLIREAVDGPKATLVPELYLAEPEAMLFALQGAEAPVVQMVAHNPGSAYLAQALAEHPPADSRFEHYPTCATTIFEFDIDNWEDVRWRSGRVVDFKVPRDLLD